MIKKIAISQFKTHCLEIVQDVQMKGQSIIITKRDRPVAEVVPIRAVNPALFGILEHQAEITGNILDPIQEKWDAEDGE